MVLMTHSGSYSSTNNTRQQLLLLHQRKMSVHHCMMLCIQLLDQWLVVMLMWKEEELEDMLPTPSNTSQIMACVHVSIQSHLTVSYITLWGHMDQLAAANLSTCTSLYQSAASYLESVSAPIGYIQLTFIQCLHINVLSQNIDTCFLP